MKKEKMCFSGQRGKKRICTRNEFNQISRHCKQSSAWTPEGMDHPILKDITLTLEPGHIYGIYRAKRSREIELSASCTRIF